MMRPTFTVAGGISGRLALTLVVTAMAATLMVGVHWGTLAVGGSDSHCYVGQARMFAQGELSLPPPLPPEISWPGASAAYAPSGFTAAPDGSGRSVPICPAWLSLAMAGASKVGGEAALFLVVPIFGALCVWSTFVLGRHLAGPWVGAAAAALVACSPTFLYQLVQPMNDVPAAALWVASLAAAVTAAGVPDERAFKHALGAGVLAGMAVMMRPNLVPLVVAPVLIVALSRSSAPASRPQRKSFPRQFAAVAIVGAVPGIATVLWLQDIIYGSPLRSGYGSFDQIFTLHNIGTNIIRYPTWLATAHTPVLALALLAPWVGPLRKTAARLLAFAVAVIALYLPYAAFTDWWYTRFLLPALPILIVLTMTTVAALVRRFGARWQVVIVLALTVLLAGYWVQRADKLAVFQLKGLERKYRELGRYAATRMPRQAIVFAAQPSGAIRYYGRLPTLSWDAIAPDALDGVVDDLVAHGYVPYFVVESWEKDTFRGRFAGHSRAADLDWPPRMILGRVIGSIIRQEFERGAPF